jgi:hypothetical protein
MEFQANSKGTFRKASRIAKDLLDAKRGELNGPLWKMKTLDFVTLWQA